MKTTGREMQLTKQVGEYLVCAELCRNSFIATTFSGNVPLFDILATDKGGQTRHVQVKTINNGDWQFKADDFLDITVSDNGIQTINGKKIIDKDLVYVLVKLMTQGKDDFYILKIQELQNIIYRSYDGWLKKCGGRRPRNPNSMHCAVSPAGLVKYLDNWNLLKA
jgi:hypothetical protein